MFRREFLGTGFLSLFGLNNNNYENKELKTYNLSHLSGLAKKFTQVITNQDTYTYHLEDGNKFWVRLLEYNKFYNRKIRKTPIQFLEDQVFSSCCAAAGLDYEKTDGWKKYINKAKFHIQHEDAIILVSKYDLDEDLKWNVIIKNNGVKCINKNEL